MEKVIVTLGAPYGVGYEIFLKSVILCREIQETIYAVGSKQVLELFIKLYGYRYNFLSIDSTNLSIKQSLSEFDFVLIDIDSQLDTEITSVESIDEKLDGYISLLSITIGSALVRSGLFHAVCTLPVSKKNINYYNKSFIGHTEFFQYNWNEREVYMTFVSDRLSIMLLTTHVPIRLVDSLVDKKTIRKGIEAAVKLARKLDLKKICFLGLDPHAGENGVIGKKDILIKKLIDESGYRDLIDGPIPSDTAFIPSNITRYGLFISCYHDQALIPFKMLSFSDGVNLSWGMKNIRTSVDHGTAVDLIGKNVADNKSFICAFKLAYTLSSS